MDYSSPPDSSVHGILQAGILEWVAIPFSRGSSPSRDWTQVCFIAGRFFTIWAIREAPQAISCCLNQGGFLSSWLSSTQGSNLRLLHWQVDSLPLSHQGSPRIGSTFKIYLESSPFSPLLPWVSAASPCLSLGFFPHTYLSWFHATAEGTSSKLDQIMSLLCSNLPIFHSKEKPKSLKALHLSDLLSHLLTSLPLLQPHWLPATSQACQEHSFFRAFALAVPSAWTPLHYLHIERPHLLQVFAKMLPFQWVPPWPALSYTSASLFCSTWYLLICFVIFKVRLPPPHKCQLHGAKESCSLLHL